MTDLDRTGLGGLIGRDIVRVQMDDDYLQFWDIDGECLTFMVDGDCCSVAYINDFYGVRQLLDNGPIVSVEEVELTSEDMTPYFQSNAYYTQLYGYRIITEHPYWGEQSSVFSFRNESNGYYGGWMEQVKQRDGLPDLTEDKVA